MYVMVTYNSIHNGQENDMWIDMRYPLAIGAFYLPGLLMIVGGWLLGFSLDEMRLVVALLGSILGAMVAGVATAALFINCEPIWVRVGKPG